jgi:anti-anti-sigma factor
VNLVLQSEAVGKVVVIRCNGRIVTGDETLSLQQEIDRHTPVTKKIVLQLAEVKYVDSGGLGAMVRIAGALRSQHGDLMLCRISPFVHQVLEATGLLKVFTTFATEKEAVDAFHEGGRSHAATLAGQVGRILCVDTSADLLAYLSALLKRSGYEVITSRSVADAKTLVSVTRPDVVVCGPGLRANQFAVENLRQSAPRAKFLMLSSDFSTTLASDAGRALVEELRALFNPPQARS